MGIPLVDKCLQHLCSLRIDTEAALRLSKECMKEGRPKSYGASALTVGDKVWLQAKQIKIHQQSAKLGCYVTVGTLSRLGIVSPIGNVVLRVLVLESK